VPPSQLLRQPPFSPPSSIIIARVLGEKPIKERKMKIFPFELTDNAGEPVLGNGAC